MRAAGPALDKRPEGPRPRPWKGEPDFYRVLALFTGDRAQMEDFLQAWLFWGGGLDVTAAPLAGKDAGTSAVSVGRVPAYALIGWWLGRPLQWQLFYQPLRAAADGGSPPRGVYLPWGYESGPLPEDGAEALLRLPAGGEVRLPPAEAFRNLFELFDRRGLVFVPPDGGPRIAAEPVADKAGSRFNLLLRLVRERPRPANPDWELARLRKRIALLEEQAETLAWWSEPEEHGEMLIYPETGSIQAQGGTLWELRSWFAEARQEHIDQYRHALVRVPPLGALHVLVLPKPAKKPAAPPEPTYRLRLDPRWSRLNRQLYVPEGWELCPPPPLGNPHVQNLMARALWEDAGAGDTLVLLRTPDGRMVRFAVSGFAPLSERVETLNFQVSFLRSRQEPGADGSEGPARFLRELRRRLDERLGEHARAIRERLSSFWQGEKAEVERYREQVAEVLEAAAAIRSARARVLEIQHSEVSGWSGFCQEVLRLDRERLPPARRPLADLVAELDRVRSDLVETAERLADVPEARQRLASRLRELAQRLGVGP